MDSSNSEDKAIINRIIMELAKAYGARKDRSGDGTFDIPVALVEKIQASTPDQVKDVVTQYWKDQGFNAVSPSTYEAIDTAIANGESARSNRTALATTQAQDTVINEVIGWYANEGYGAVPPELLEKLYRSDNITDAKKIAQDYYTKVNGSFDADSTLYSTIDSAVASAPVTSSVDPPTTTTTLNEAQREAYWQHQGDVYTAKGEELLKQSEAAARRIIPEEIAQGRDIDGNGMVGHTPLADFQKRDVKGAFDSQQATLQTQIEQDGPSSALVAELNKSHETQAGVTAAVNKVDEKIKANTVASFGDAIPNSVARAEQADMNAQLKQEKKKVEEFGVEVASMSPDERANLDKFFALAKEKPEEFKQFTNSVAAKDKQVALVDEKIKANTVASFGDAIPNSVARAEQADMNAQLKQEKATVAAAPLNPDVNPAFVSSLNPTGSIQKDKELKAFFAKVEADKKAAAQAQVRADQEEQRFLAQRKVTANKKPAVTGGGNTGGANDNPMPFPPPKPSTAKIQYR